MPTTKSARMVVLQYGNSTTKPTDLLILQQQKCVNSLQSNWIFQGYPMKGKLPVQYFNQKMTTIGVTVHNLEINSMKPIKRYLNKQIYLISQVCLNTHNLQFGKMSTERELAWPLQDRIPGLEGATSTMFSIASSKETKGQVLPRRTNFVQTNLGECGIQKSLLSHCIKFEGHNRDLETDWPIFGLQHSAPNKIYTFQKQSLQNTVGHNIAHDLKNKLLST